MFIALLLSLLPAISLVDGAFTPRSRNIHARHAAIVGARAPVPVPVPVQAPVNKRSSKKCRQRPSSSSLAPSSTPVAPVNPVQDPNHTSQQQQQPTPTTQVPKPPPTTTTPAPQPTHTSGGGGGGSGGSGGNGNDPFGNFFAGTQVGQLTYYELGLTACGQTFSDSDFVAAVSHSLFDIVPGANGNPNDNPICGKKVNVEYNGNSITVSIVDRCVGCAPTDLDLSPTAFSQLASQSLGRLSGAKWHWA